MQAVALDPFGVGAIVDALYEIGIDGQERVVGITQAGSFLAPAKIDSLMAAFNAVALMAMNPHAAGRSYLRSSKMLVLLWRAMPSGEAGQSENGPDSPIDRSAKQPTDDIQILPELGADHRQEEQ